MNNRNKRTIIIASATAFAVACVAVYGYGVWRVRIEDELALRNIRVYEETPRWVERTNDFVVIRFQEWPKFRKRLMAVTAPVFAVGSPPPHEVFIQYPADDVGDYSIFGSSLFRNVEKMNVLYDYDQSNILTQLPEIPACGDLGLICATRIEAGDLAAIYHNFPSLEELHLNAFFVSWEDTELFRDREITTLALTMVTSANTPEINEIRSDLTRPTPEQMEHIVANFPHVEELRLHLEDPESIQLAERLPNLETLSLGGNPPLAEVDLRRFPRLNHLEVYAFYKELSYLLEGPPAPNIKTLHIGGKAKFEFPVEALRPKFPNLERLSFRQGVVARVTLQSVFDIDSVQVVSLENFLLEGDHPGPKIVPRSQVVIHRANLDTEELAEEYPNARLLSLDQLDEIFGP